MQRPYDYATIQASPDTQPASFSVAKAAAIAIGMALGLGALLYSSASPALHLHQVASTRTTSTGLQYTNLASALQPISAAQPATRAAAAPLQMANTASGTELTATSSAMPQVPSTWSTAAAFLAGCAMAVVGMALQLRRRPPQPAPHWEQETIAMMGLVGDREVAEAPPVLGKDKDEGCLRRRFESMLRHAQANICAAIEKSDGEAKFRTDAWLREGGGGGMSKVLANGKVWEKAGVNLSVIYGTMPSETLAAARERQANYAKDLVPGERVPFFACGLSCVMHPRNPHCPTMHFNYRYFETDAGDWWFGGGTDITPAYLDEEDMKHFHGVYKEVCDRHDPEFYPKFKKWADEYFVIKHRGETRGLGGIFFDDLNDRDPMTIFSFAEDCLNHVVPAYVPIIEKHKNDTFTEEQKRWQLLRRGRYVEFNLVYDRGTIFGLKTGLGRTESIMMTLPQYARWEYDQHPAPGSEEAKILEAFKNPRDWV